MLRTKIRLVQKVKDDHNHMVAAFLFGLGRGREKGFWETRTMTKKKGGARERKRERGWEEIKQASTEEKQVGRREIGSEAAGV